MIARLVNGNDAVGLPGLAVIAASFLIFAIALLAARTRAGTEERGNTRRSHRSVGGIAVQALAFFVASFGPQHIALDPLGTKALVEAAAVAVLMATAIGLFFAAARAMGRNWSLVARTREDHQLVQTGPFAHLRHPIYTALFLVMVAIAIAFGHTGRLLIAAPLYALGTWLRVSEEERLLRAMFGADHDAYAARVKRFVPRLF